MTRRFSRKFEPEAYRSCFRWLDIRSPEGRSRSDAMAAPPMEPLFGATSYQESRSLELHAMVLAMGALARTTAPFPFLLSSIVGRGVRGRIAYLGPRSCGTIRRTNRSGRRTTRYSVPRTLHAAYG